jgi:hypothetical protein
MSTRLVAHGSPALRGRHEVPDRDADTHCARSQDQLTDGQLWATLVPWNRD